MWLTSSAENHLQDQFCVFSHPLRISLFTNTASKLCPSSAALMKGNTWKPEEIQQRKTDQIKDMHTAEDKTGQQVQLIAHIFTSPETVDQKSCDDVCASGDYTIKSFSLLLFPSLSACISILKLQDHICQRDKQHSHSGRMRFLFKNKKWIEENYCLFSKRTDEEHLWSDIIGSYIHIPMMGSGSEI